MIEWVAAAAAVAAAWFAWLTWDASRERQPFRLSPLSHNVVVLTWTSRLPVRLVGVVVPHHLSLFSTDDRAEIAGRDLRRFGFVVLDIPSAIPMPVGETVVVHYRRWPRTVKGKVRYWSAPILGA